MKEPSVIPLNTPRTREPDRIRVYLRQCRVDLHVGYHPHERGRTQPLIIDLEVEAALPHRYHAPHDKNLDHVIDYDPFLDFIRNQLPKMGHIPLLETVAERIIDFCFKDQRIQVVRVSIEKPEIFGGLALPGIEVQRTRPQGS